MFTDNILIENILQPVILTVNETNPKVMAVWRYFYLKDVIATFSSFTDEQNLFDSDLRTESNR